MAAKVMFHISFMASQVYLQT